MKNDIRAVAFIGGGNMAEAFVCGMRAGAQTRDTDIRVCDVRAERTAELAEKYGTRAAQSVTRAYLEADLTVLAVKPQDLRPVLEEIRAAALSAGSAPKTVMSIAAGVPLSFIAGFVPAGTQLVRVMPNLPCLYARGVSGYFVAPGTLPAAEEACRAILACTGRTVKFEDETELHAVTALSGSGPAYVFHFIDSLTRAGQAMGLKRDQSLSLALSTVAGSCAMLEESGADAGGLIAKVASKGGTTEAALKVMAERGVKEGIVAGCKAAEARGQELGKLLGAG